MEARVAWVTGGTRGIGLAIAERLAKDGMRVAVNGRALTDEVQNHVRALQQAGADILLLAGDVSRAEDVTRMAEEIEAAFGPVDVLVNNAGINRDNLLLRTKEQDMRDILDVNLMGTFFCSRAVARSMTKRRWGRIINVSSVVGLTGNVGQTAYSASKAAVFGMTKTIARELSARGVTVNAVAPGFIETEMTEALPEEVRERIVGEIPLKRMGDVSDVASLVSFLAGEQSGYITGQTLVVDGGLSL